MNLYRDLSTTSSVVVPLQTLLFMGFNQDYGCLAIGTNTGFIIYNVDPFRETFRRLFTNGGIGIVEMLFRCNLIAIVGGGRNPRYPTNKVVIWDDHQSKCIGELMVKYEVLAVRLRRDRVVVVVEKKVYVHRFSDLKLLHQIVTLPNPRGLIAQCPDPETNILAIPGLVRGWVRVELFHISKATIIKAHDTELAQIALSANGSKLATASEKGTLVRLWDCYTGDPLREFRRGIDRADIYCLSFCPSTQFLACSSDKGTIHIFSLSEERRLQDNIGAKGGSTETSSSSSSHTEASAATSRVFESGGAISSSNNPRRLSGGNSEQNPVASNGGDNAPSSSSSASSSGDTPNKSLGIASVLRGFLPPAMVPKYLSSEWSFAQIRGIETKCICAFDKTGQKLLIVCADGTFIVSNFEEGRIETSRVSTTKFYSDDESGSTNG